MFKWLKRIIHDPLTPEQVIQIESEYSEMKKYYDKKAKDQRDSDDRVDKEINSTCPHCRKQTDIVDKIAHVQGEGKVYGDFNLGFGTVSGSSSTDTHSVNHCNGCGHEWKKSNIENVYGYKLLSSDLQTLGYSMTDDGWEEYLPRYVAKFSEYCAESILEAYKDNYHSVSSGAADGFTLKTLKKYFKSVRDEG